MRKLLIIDDEIEQRRKDYLELYSEAIEEKLYGVQFAASGEEGLAILKKDTKQEISLILLDLRMDNAKMDGISLANSLGENYINRSILVYTAYPDLASKLSQQARQNVITVIERSKRSPQVIKDLVDVFIIGGALEVPGDSKITTESKSVGYPTIRKLVKTLSNELRVTLIREILPYFPAQTLVSLKKSLPEEIDKVLAEAVERDILRK
jgi:CheY-like chemotaxis protein